MTYPAYDIETAGFPGRRGLPGAGNNVVESRSDLEAVDTSAVSLCYVEEVDAWYSFIGSSVAAADEWGIIAPNVGGGRWFLNSDGLLVQAIGGGADDSPNLTAAGASLAALGKEMRLGPNTYTGATTFSWPVAALVIHMDPLTRINSTLVPTGSPTNALFYCAMGGVEGSTTVASANTIGLKTVSLVAAPAAGQYVRILDTASATGFKGSTYKVRSVTGAGPYTVTLDRPVRTQFGAGDQADFFDTVASGHRIYGNGARLTGSGTRLFEFIGTRHCEVEDLVFEPNGVTDFTGSFDIGGYNNHFRDCRLDGSTGTGANDGLVLETQEASTVESKVRNVAVRGVLIMDCVDCEDRSTVSGCQFGVVIGTDGDTTGSEACRVRGYYYQNSTYGIAIGNGSRQTDVKATAKYNGTNLAIGDATGGNVTGTVASGDFSSALTGGILVYSSAVGTSLGIVDTSNCPLGINPQGPISIEKHIHHGTVSGSFPNALFNDSNTVILRGADYNITTGGINAIKTTGTGKTTALTGKIIAGAASNCFLGDSTSVTVIGTVIGSSSGASHGVQLNGGTATLRFLGGDDFSGCLSRVAGAGAIFPTMSSQVSTVGTTAVTTEEILKTATIPASTLKTGMRATVRAWGSIANNANAKTIRLRFGNVTGDSALLARTMPTSVAASWDLTAEIRCTGSNTQECITKMIIGSDKSETLRAARTEPDTGSLFVELSGQNGTASANDIVCNGFEVTLLAA